ncbi:MAG: hypothetical protein GY725_01730 [bacterium]|nr:hypothetical protein [bacterium]
MITEPPALAPGTLYRLAFVTSGTTNATSTDIAVYDAFVQATAGTVPELAALGTTWQAIGSTDTVDAITHTGTDSGVGSTVPIYLLNGTLLAANGADLWDGSIPVKFNISQSATTLPDDYWQWTGTLANGFKDGFLALGGGGQSTIGRTNDLNGFWVQWDNWIQTDGSTNGLHAISAVLAIPNVDSCAVGSGAGTGCSPHGGPVVRGGVQATFDNVVTPGTFTAEACEVPADDVEDLSGPFCGLNPGALTFGLPTDPVLFWDLDFDGTFTGEITLTFGYGDAQLASGFNTENFAIYHDEGGGLVSIDTSIDSVAKTVTVQVSSLSPFVLGKAAVGVPLLPVSTLFVFVGAIAMLLTVALIYKKAD